VTYPIGIIHGTHDNMVSLQHSLQLYAFLTGQPAPGTSPTSHQNGNTFLTIVDGRHEAFIDIALAFLRS
jgi:dipeptidyl aminopeptidase/acylaminoacyl peptidase